jgi:hyaluronan synthase
MWDETPGHSDPTTPIRHHPVTQRHSVAGIDHVERMPVTGSTVVVRRTSIVPLTLFAMACTVGYVFLRGTIGWYGAILLTYLGGKLLLSVLPFREPRGATPNLKVGVVVTAYNEDPDTLAKCLESIAAQTYLPRAVMVVDDASDSPLAPIKAQQVIDSWGGRLVGKVLFHQENVGKREALGTGFRELPDVDLFVCIDSDAVLDPDAIRQGVRTFLDPQVVAATGVAIASNHRKNILTRLIDLRYVNAFLGERAAYSRFGSVLCVTGVLAFWRADLIRLHLDSFLNQMFMGRKQNLGDDRHLTNLLQGYGKVVLARRAVAATVVPEKLGHYVRQQARWGRSFWRESLWALRNLPKRQLAWWLSLIEVVATTIFTFGLLVALIVDPILTGEWHIASYLQWVAIGAWARSVHAFTVKREGNWIGDSLIAIAAAPFFGLLCLVLILPLRIWALVTIRRTAWGTRSVVEVSETPEYVPPAIDPVKQPV